MAEFTITDINFNKTEAQDFFTTPCKDLEKRYKWKVKVTTPTDSPLAGKMRMRVETDDKDAQEALEKARNKLKEEL